VAPGLLIIEKMESGHPLDPLIAAADRALRALFAPAHASRPLPVPQPKTHPSVGGPPAKTPSSPALPDSEIAAVAAQSESELTENERLKAAALMRVNHAGEIAAQALYHGQALVSRSEQTRTLLLRSAREESDHLAWCEMRLTELGSRPSLLNPLWYCGAFAIGTLAAAGGDRWSLGFVVETERQVEGHLDEHLERLPAGDRRSQAILRTMREEEIGHGRTARAAGAAELPQPVRLLMKQAARIMTTTSYWL